MVAVVTHPTYPYRRLPVKNQIKALKVKIKSLAAEARIIRLEEKRASKRRYIKPSVSISRVWTYHGDNDLRESLHRHRIDVVRVEARHSLLAYAFLRGVPYAAVERRPKIGCQKFSQWVPPNWAKVEAMVIKFGSVPGQPGGPTMVKETVRAWALGQLPAAV